MPTPLASPTASLDPIPRSRFGYDEARHLLWRGAFGGTPPEIEALVDLGPEGAVDRLLDAPGAGAARAEQFRPDIIREWTDAEEEQLRRARSRRDENTLAK